MAVGTTTAIAMGALAAGGAVKAFSEQKSGQQMAKNVTRQAEWNAQVYEQQASMITEKQKLQDYQFYRQAARLRGALVARTAGNGLLLSGSPAAIMVDNESQMLLDKAAGDYNLSVERNFALSSAANQRLQGGEQARLARATGNTNAFSSILNTVSDIGLLNIGKRAGKI